MNVALKTMLLLKGLTLFIFLSSLITLSDSVDFEESDKFFGGKDTCTELLESYANTSASFTYCAVKHARPIRICEMCVEMFEDVRNVHQKILQVEDESGKCRERLMNLDRLEVIEEGYRYITDLWDRASCNYCFDYSNDTYHVSNNTVQFMDLLNTTRICFTKYQIGDDVYNKSACVACEAAYCDLNKYYDKLKNSQVDVCMDIVDSMNITRMLWNDKLHCKKDRPKMDVIYLACTCTIAALPILFYLGAKLFTTAIRNRLQMQKRLFEILRPSTSAET